MAARNIRRDAGEIGHESAAHVHRNFCQERRNMAPKSTLVPFSPSPVRRPNGTVSAAAATVTDDERVVIRMLAQRAARQCIAEGEECRPPTESDP